MPPPRKITALANEKVPFASAAAWAGLPAVSERGTKTDCPRCGSESACRLYLDHGWCFSCRTRLSVVVLLAETWDMDYEDAALAALDKIGYVPASLADMWQHAVREPGLDLPQLGEALKTWCAGNLADWEHRQYDEVPARVLRLCLGSLSRVRTERDCDVWLSRCKGYMQRACALPVAR